MDEPNLARLALMAARYRRPADWAAFSPDVRELVERAYYQEFLTAFPQYAELEAIA